MFSFCKKEKTDLQPRLCFRVANRRGPAAPAAPASPAAAARPRRRPARTPSAARRATFFSFSTRRRCVEGIESRISCPTSRVSFRVSREKPPSFMFVLYEYVQGATISTPFREFFSLSSPGGSVRGERANFTRLDTFSSVSKQKLASETIYCKYNTK